MITQDAPGSAGQKIETYTFPGPVIMPLRNIIFPFMAISMLITNASSQTLYLDMSDVPTFQTAKIIVPPNNVYHVHGWFDNHLFLNASGNLTATEFITLQVCDHMTTLPMASLAATFIPSSSTAGDVAPNPTTGSDISFQMVFNPSTALWERQRVASGDSLATTGVSASGNVVFNANTGVWERERVASTDNLPATGLLASGSMVYNPISGQWDRNREASADGIGVTGIPASGGMAWNGSGWSRIRTAADGLTATGLPAVSTSIFDQSTTLYNVQRSSSQDGVSSIGLAASGVMVFDQAGGLWSRLSSPQSDALGTFGKPGVLPMVFNSVSGLWNRVKEPTTDAMAITGFAGVGPMVFDNTFGWSRFRSPVADGQGAPGYAGVQPLLYSVLANTSDRARMASAVAQPLNGMQCIIPYVFDGSVAGGPAYIWRGASAPNTAVSNGSGVAQVVEPGHWLLRGLDGGGTSPASITRGAVAGTRHVLRTISACYLCQTASAVGTLGLFVVRDGATGAGTILWEAYLQVSPLAGSRDRLELSGLSIVGSVNTPMTVEFTAMTLGFQQSISATGYEAV